MGRSRVPRVVEDVFWKEWTGGASWDDAIAVAGVSKGTARSWVRQRGGVKPVPKSDGRGLTLEDRFAIQHGIKHEQTDAEIARDIGVDRATVGREIRRNTAPSTVGPANRRRVYRAMKAQEMADARARRPKPRKLDVNPVLHEYVQDKLTQTWSPEQIAARLRRDFGQDPEMTISHEAIYQCIYVKGVGGLKRELTARLRTGRTVRKPRRQAGQRRPRIKDMTSITERPEEALGRAVPGHWEGDLILGSMNASAIGTLVDRSSRWVSLLHLPDDHGAEQVRDEMVAALLRMPEQLRRTVTWDQGSEMHRHLEITDLTGVTVYFCHPHSPWERPTNENTNGLLREFFPKGTDLSQYTREDLDHVERLLNSRPRKALNWDSPAEHLDKKLGADIAVALTS